MSDPGLQAIRQYISSAGIDEKWSGWDTRGFVWWPHDLAQHVSAADGRIDSDLTIYRVMAETPVVSGVTAPEAAKTIAHLSGTASVASLVYDPRRASVSYVSTVYLQEQTAEWAGRLFSTAAAIQAAMAGGQCELLAKALGGSVCRSSHPVSGPRTVPDDVLNAIRDRVLPKSAPTAPAVLAELADLSRQLTEAGCLSMCSNGEFSVEFPWGADGGPATLGKRSALLLLDPNTEHPGLGQGGLFRLYTPGPEGGVAPELANELNRQERATFMGADGLGSWCVGTLPGNAGRGLVYVSFIPSLLFEESAVTNLVMSMALRARWVAEVLDGVGAVRQGDGGAEGGGVGEPPARAGKRRKFFRRFLR